MTHFTTLSTCIANHQGKIQRKKKVKNVTFQNFQILSLLLKLMPNYVVCNAVVLYLSTYMCVYMYIYTYMFV